MINSKSFLLFICLFITKIASADVISEVSAVADLWNKFHNQHNPNGLSELYDQQVFFYGRKCQKKQCIIIKENFITDNFIQEIIGGYSITEYTSGYVKCEFIKKVTAKKTHEYDAYLVMRKIKGKYLITAESDVLTDARKNVSLNLGAEKTTILKRINGWIKYIIPSAVGVMIIFLFYYLKNNRRNKKPGNIQETNNIQNEFKDSKNIIGNNTKKKNIEDKKDLSKTKGDDFENFVVKRFDRDYFKLLEWRSDKYHEGIYAQTNHYPDMVFELNHDYVQKKKFAVECKYRSSYTDDRIEIAYPYQLKNYENFATDNKMPVFIILGIGGTPNLPEELFAIPITKLYNNNISKSTLQKFKKHKVEGSFFYNPETKILN